MAEPHVAEKAVTAQNEFTPWLGVSGENQVLDIKVLGYSAGTVTLQYRSSSAGTTYDEKSYTAKAHDVLDAPGKGEYRLGVKTGDYSAAVTCRLEVGRRK